MVLMLLKKVQYQLLTINKKEKENMSIPKYVKEYLAGDPNDDVEAIEEPETEESTEENDSE